MVFYDEQDRGYKGAVRDSQQDFGGWAETAAAINETFASRSYPNWRQAGSRARSDDQKADALDAVLAVWRENPELRLGQLLRNALRAHMPGGFDDARFARGMFYIEDADLLTALEKFNEDRRVYQERHRANQAALRAAAEDGVGE